MRALARVAAAALLVTAGCHNDNTVTGPASLPTPTPTPTPATLSGQVVARTGFGNAAYLPYGDARIEISQGATVLHATASSDGSYTIAGLRPGPAVVSASQSGEIHCQACSSGNLALTLYPGVNTKVLDMQCRAINGPPFCF